MSRTRSQDGKTIRALREQRQIAIRELADRIGIRRQALSNIEVGNRRASKVVLISIARELGVPLDDIMRREDEDDGEQSEAA